MKNQFFYTDTSVKDKPKQASFNPEYVIRSLEVEPNRLVIMLDDFHEMQGPVQKMNKNGKVIVQTEKQTVCSEIWLNEEDSKRFRELTEI